MNDEMPLRIGTGYDPEYEAFIRTTVTTLVRFTEEEPRKAWMALVSIIVNGFLDHPNLAEGMKALTKDVIDRVADSKAALAEQERQKPTHPGGTA